MENKNQKERRRHPRVSVDKSSPGIKATIKDWGESTIFDVSFGGAALSQPQDKKVDSSDSPLCLILETAEKKAEIKAKVIRVNDRVVALEFDQQDAKARQLIDELVSDRIVGMNMNLIDSKHYSVKADFGFWFHGPKDTNLYLWTRGEQLEKAHLEMGTSLLVFEHDSFLIENKTTLASPNRLNNQQIFVKAWSILEQMSANISPLQQLKKLLLDHVQG